MAKQRAPATKPVPRPPTKQKEQAGPLPVPDPKKIQKLYYAGLQLPSPEGGFLEVLRVRPEEDHSATIIFECNTSSLRYSLEIPAATRTERKKVKDAQEEGLDPTCPRHGPGMRLNRVGGQLVCPLCGIAYGKV
jgi:hypothetical protein